MIKIFMAGINFYVIDTETTGLKNGYHEICEISIIRYSDRVQLSRQVICKYPERASFDALNITKKTIHDLENGFDSEKVVNDCEKFFSEDGLTASHRCIIAHNAAFDRKFLHALWEEHKKVFPADLWLDTVVLTRFYAKQIGLIKPKVNLQAACDMVGVKKISGVHNAKSDSRNTYLLHKELVESKKVDYLPFIKTASHAISSMEDYDMSLLEDAV